MLALSFSATADAPLPLKIRGYDYPPLFFVNEHQQIDGKLVDVFKAICRLQNFDCEFSAISAARTYLQFEEGGVDILLTGKIPRFSACCTVSDWSYKSVGGIYSTEVLSPKFDSSILKNKTLIIPLGFELPYLAFKDLKTLEEQKQTRVIQARTARLTLKMFGKGRGDFVWSSPETASLLREYSDDKETPYYFYPLKTVPVVAWVNRNNPHYDRIIHGLNQAYAELTASNQIAPDGLLAQ